jgi:hypothetical protein
MTRQLSRKWAAVHHVRLRKVQHSKTICRGAQKISNVAQAFPMVHVNVSAFENEPPTFSFFPEQPLAGISRTRRTARFQRDLERLPIEIRWQPLFAV